jgi:hypothetical protein
MSRLKLVVLAALVVALIALAVFGGGWKWSHPKDGYAPQKLAGWTWDGDAVGLAPGEG